MKPGLFVDPPATLLRKPTAAPTVTPRECFALTLTATEWKPGKIIDPDGPIADAFMHALDREGWEIVPKTAKRRQQ